VRYLAVSVVLHLLFFLIVKVSENVRVPKFSVSGSTFNLIRLSNQKSGKGFSAGEARVAPVGGLPPLKMGEGTLLATGPAPLESTKINNAPRSFYMPQPHYPEVAREREWEGEVVFEFKTDRHGYIESLNIVSSSGFRLLDEEAYQTVKQWRVAPLLTDAFIIKFWPKQ